jgi:hypothetical protein
MSSSRSRANARNGSAPLTPSTRRSSAARCTRTGRSARGGLGSGPGSGGGFEQTIADIDVKEAGGGRNSAVDYERAFAIRERVDKIKHALKGRLSKSKRLSLTQELAQLTGDLNALSPQAADPADAGDGDDPNQPLIDAINAAAEQAAEIAAAQAAAEAEHTAALKDVAGQMKRANDIRSAIQSTDNFQLTKYVADLLGGFVVGRGVVGRSFTPGTGVEHAY